VSKSWELFFFSVAQYWKSDSVYGIMTKQNEHGESYRDLLHGKIRRDPAVINRHRTSSTHHSIHEIPLLSFIDFQKTITASETVQEKFPTTLATLCEGVYIEICIQNISGIESSEREKISSVVFRK
jgi:hypothetical protein